MDVLIKHNGTNISTSVISYERVHKICTGIGTLTIQIERTIGRTFEPWDSIDIHENGDFKVRYYISEVVDAVPQGTITLECQDISKRLVDYFISDSYTVDYPSYTRYWIEKFLEEAGIDFIFNTSSSGNLLSNFTHLGLVSAYEQILILLQLSGWYIYFDGNEKAVIGPLNADLAISNRHIDRDDILTITKLEDDKMLRNRALVLGAFDPFSLTYAVADVTVHTRWNYDRQDVRAMVVSNSNIPNRGSAYSIANLLLKEFARATIEKHVEVHGARNYNLGEAIRVDSTVWKGKGLITTFGTRMDKTGLITILVIDERCPRLFGFFDFGDYVYVGTFGDGVWKKHIKFDHTWSNFSTGLTNLEITDLHVNNGIFGSIGSQGEMYRTLEDSSWSPVTITGLLSSQAVTASGDAVNWVGFSGIKGRATIVDKYSNILKFGVDTWSGMNYGDYFLNYSGWLGFTAFSGVVGSGMATLSGSRGWIVEYDPFTGLPLGGLGSGIYPISVSGNYDIRVIDLENDGYNDYVSVKLGGGGGVEQGELGYAMGEYSTQAFFDTHDSNAFVLQPAIVPDRDARITGSIDFLHNVNSVMAVDNGVTGERDLITIDTSKVIRRQRFSLDIDGNVISSTISNSLGGSDTVLKIHRVNSALYRIYFYTSVLFNIKVSYIEWNTDTNTLGTLTEIHNYSTAPYDANRSSDTIAVGDFAYIVTLNVDAEQTQGGANVFPQHVRYFLTTVNLLSITANTVEYFHFETPESSTPGLYDYFPDDSGHTAGIPSNESFIRYGLFQDGETIKFIGWLEYGYHSDRWTEITIVGNASSANYVQLHDAAHPSRWGNLSTWTGYNGRTKSQLTRTEGLIVMAGSSGSLGFAFNGTVFTTFTNAPPYYLDPEFIYPIYRRTNTRGYIARDPSGNYFVCDALALGVSNQIPHPGGWFLRRPFSNPISFDDSIYWAIRNADTFEMYLTIAPDINTVPVAGAFFCDFSSATRRSTNIGGFFLMQPNDWLAASPLLTTEYIYFGPDELISATFLVLKREGMQFTIVEEEAYPIRIDISNSSPVLAVGSGVGSFVSSFVTDSEVFQVFPTPTLSGTQVNDYRYTLLEPTYSGISPSGLGVEMTGLYVFGSGVFGFDVNTYSGGFQVIYPVPSGMGTRIETSNFGLGGQYVFVTASGFTTPLFYQKDPQNSAFTYYSGLPASRPTIIRLDDRI